MRAIAILLAIGLAGCSNTPEDYARRQAVARGLSGLGDGMVVPQAQAPAQTPYRAPTQCHSVRNIDGSVNTVCQ